MTTLKKKIFHSKIQNIVSENKFVLFFQFNNVKFTDWIFVKNQIFNFKNINVIVIKNKISYKTFLNNQTKIKFFSPFNDSKLSFKINFTEEYVEYKNHLPFANNSICVAKQETKWKYKQSNEARFSASLVTKFRAFPWHRNLPSAGLLHYNRSIEMCKNLHSNPEKLNFLCQGPTLMIYFNSINQCKVVYDILNQYTSNFFSAQSMCKSEFLDSYKYKKTCLNTTNLPLLFLQKKSNLYLQKHNSIKKKNMKSTFFFIGGFFKGKILNHLDFEKVLQLNDSIYVDLITQYSNPILKIFLLNVIVKIKFLKCFQNNLLSLLNVYKHNLKKIPI